jgi:uncharacterized protein YcfL
LKEKKNNYHQQKLFQTHQLIGAIQSWNPKALKTSLDKAKVKILYQGQYKPLLLRNKIYIYLVLSQNLLRNNSLLEFHLGIGLLDIFLYQEE